MSGRRGVAGVCDCLPTRVLEGRGCMHKSMIVRRGAVMILSSDSDSVYSMYSIYTCLCSLSHVFVHMLVAKRREWRLGVSWWFSRHNHVLCTVHCTNTAGV